MTTLSSHDRQTFDAIFRHPVSGNIEWHDVVALFKHLGEVIDEPNGKMKFIRNGQSLVLHAQGKDLQRETVADIRKFLKKSDKPNGHPTEGAFHLLVLDHAGARIYRTESPGSEATVIEPADPHGRNKQVHDSHPTALSNTSDPHREFFERIATELSQAERIVIFGAGQGSSNECQHFLDDMKKHHPQVALRVTGTENVDLGHLTEGEVLALARDHFASLLVAAM